MKFMVNCAFSAALSTLLIASSSAFSNPQLKTPLSTATNSNVQQSALCMSDEKDDYDDFFADYDRLM